jgi:hypothetical protein
MKLKKAGQYAVLTETAVYTEMLVKTAKCRFRVFEVPISFTRRTYGSSSVDFLHDGFKIFVSIVSARVRKV